MSGKNAVVLQPGAVHVLQGVRQQLGGTSVIIEAGDTVFPLDYLGEGRYNAWYGGGIIRVESFWPSSESSLSAFSGTVLQESNVEYWLQISADDVMSGWVKEQGNDMLGPRARRTGHCDSPL